MRTVLIARVVKCRNMTPGSRAGNIEKFDFVQLSMPSVKRTTKWELIRDQTNIRLGSASSTTALSTTELSILQLSGSQLFKKSCTIQRACTCILLCSGKPTTIYLQPRESISHTHTNKQTHTHKHTHTQYAYIYIYVFIYTYAYILCVYIYIYIYIYIISPNLAWCVTHIVLDLTNLIIQGNLMLVQSH
jgi:hypothetical protein